MTAYKISDTEYLVPGGIGYGENSGGRSMRADVLRRLELEGRPVIVWLSSSSSAEGKVMVVTDDLLVLELADGRRAFVDLAAIQCITDHCFPEQFKQREA